MRGITRWFTYRLLAGIQLPKKGVRNMTKEVFNQAKVKDLIASPKVQEAMKEMISVPKNIIVKQVRNPFINQETNETTQKIHAVAGTSLMDMVELDLTLVGGQTIDAVEAINKTYQIESFNLPLGANMYKIRRKKQVKVPM